MTTPLTLVPPPVPGEALLSWLYRIAAANNMPLTWLLTSAGLAPSAYWQEARLSWLGTHITDVQATSLAQATGQTIQTIQSMQTTGWIGTFTTGTDQKGQDLSSDSRRYAAHNWNARGGFDYCPDCLHETQAWQLTWKLPWHFVCTKHANYLLTVCPKCQQRPESGGTDGGQGPRFPTYIPQPGHCHNPRRQVEAARSKGPCWHDFRQDQSPLPVPSWTLELQTQLLRESRAYEWWNDLRALAVYSILVQSDERVADLLNVSLPAHLKQHWEETRIGRLAQLEAQRKHVASHGLDHRRMSQNTLARRPPEDTLLMSLAADVAHRCMTSDTALEQLMQDGRNDPTRTVPTTRIKALGVSENLLIRCRLAYLGKRRRLYEVGLLGNYRSTTETPITWDPNDLPPYLWDDHYDQYLAPFFNELPILRRVGKKFAIIALYRAATGTTWNEASARFLDNAVRCDIKGRVLHIVREHGGAEMKEQLLLTINQLALALNDDPRLPAYPALRETANTLFGQPISVDVYQAALPADRPKMQPTHQKRLFASVWLWTLATGDDRLNAPAWGEQPPTDQLRDIYRAWLKGTPHEVLDRLRAWGESQLSA